MHVLEHFGTPEHGQMTWIEVLVLGLRLIIVLLLILLIGALSRAVALAGNLTLNELTALPGANRPVSLLRGNLHSEIDLLVGVPLLAVGQSRTFTRDDVEYVLELPSTSWQAASRLDVHAHFEFIYQADASNGYLRLCKRFVDSGTSARDLFLHEEKWDLQRLPGYVVCTAGEGDSIEGHLSGAVFT